MPLNGNYGPHTPERELKRREYNTIKKSRFFDAFDHKAKDDSLAQICKRPDINIPPSTARTWLRKREIIGSPAYRRTRKISARLGRKYIVPTAVLDDLLRKDNPLNTKPYETIVKELHLPIKPRTLQHNFTVRKGARRYKKPRIKAISQKNRVERVKYGQEHRDKTICYFWKFVYFTDEAHFSSRELASKDEYMLRQPNGQERLSHFNEAPQGLNITLHVAAGICYDHKGEITFYNDPMDPGEVKQRKAPYPHRSSVETEAEYRQKVDDWRASQPHPLEVKGGGNSMTQKHYAEHVLPKHIETIKRLEERHKHRYILQEDNDGSHGTRSLRNPCRRLKINANLDLLLHPAQSPDLNPIEGIWEIIKQRLRGGRWATVEEFKAAILREWRHITQDEIRRRIREMPWRCRKLCINNGDRIRSNLW